VRASLFLIFGVAAIFCVLSAAPAQPPQPPVYGYRIVHTYPHDRAAFTQGLEYHDGFLYESTGLNGKSGIRRVALESGMVLHQAAIDEQYFGEGITVLNHRLLELTWQSHRGFIYDADTFRDAGGFQYPGEGWGLANDGRRIFMSDGTAQIRFWNPSTLEETGRITVHDGPQQVASLNELEYVRGEIYANVWTTDRIVRADPSDGRVTGWIDLTGLLTPAEIAEGADVLNGIAYDPATDRLFVTGKLWPKLFEIQLVPRS
jgi:glutamine cyclotransferase